MVRWCWVNFQCRGVLLIWIRVGQGPIALAVGAGRGCLDIFSLVYHFSRLFSLSLGDGRYRLKYCLKRPLSPKQQTNKQAKSGSSVSQAQSNMYISSSLDYPATLQRRWGTTDDFTTTFSTYSCFQVPYLC